MTDACRTTRRRALARGAALLLLAAPLLLAGCGSDTPARSYDALRYDYLTRIKLDVARIDIDDNWVPQGSARHVEYLAPTRPITALRQMAEDRLITGGNKGSAHFVVDDASIIQTTTRFEAHFAVHLDVLAEDGTKRTTVTARVSGVRPITDSEDPVAVRTDLYELTRKLMDDMNIELEFQLRRALKDQLQNTSPDAPPPGAVESQDLTAPTKP